MVSSLHSQLVVWLIAVAQFYLSSSHVIRRHGNSSINSASITIHPALSNSQRQSDDFGMYAFDRCTPARGCAGDRWCLRAVATGICGPGDTCICDHNTGSEEALCNTTKDCVPEEGCIRPPAGAFKICMSRAAAEGLGYPLIEDNSPPAPSADPSTPSTCTGGLRLDPCRVDSDCRQSPLSARCYGVFYGIKVAGGPCLGEEECACLQGSLRPCEDSLDCECGETCIIGIEGNQFCGSRQEAFKRRLPTIEAPASSIPSTEEPAPCIAIEALQHMARKDLIFEHGRLANVLCDASNSCATPGHMVNFKGRTMMMSSYCKMVGCEKAVMHVNSPKWRRRLTVGSKSEDMVFLAFAARYGTKAEEAFISGLVRAGL